ncbi:MFS transporter [Mesorhizobium sp. M9A.F.Ca.ET.002.03.1.2]|uniref:MFS transporter n=1 Tax=Mesorhizobium sp. M9A.F.Ca.ET.002.03.1.2 TaxID=2493668 RepID=UPI001AED00C4|nr:MFS transporter [Mesorhizobium sp. M9A.F.Ca.ET.002.03.1.2]
MSTIENGTSEARPGWAALLSGKNAVHSIILAGGVTLHALNIYIVTTILPSVVADIGGLEYYAWSTTLFVVASILGAALSSRLLERAGPGRAYASATALFVTGALICAAAPAFPVLLAGRFVQGLGGGLLYALAYAVIRLVYPEALWSRAIGLISAMWGVSTLIGPAVGGVFAELSIWRAAFWSLVPLSVIFGAIAITVLPRGRRDEAESSPLPLPQLVLLTASVVAVSAGSVSVNPLWNAVGLVLAGLLAALLVRAELGARPPVAEGSARYRRTTCCALRDDRPPGDGDAGRYLRAVSPPGTSQSVAFDRRLPRRADGHGLDARLHAKRGSVR